MFIKTLLTTAAAIGFIAGPAFAQQAAPAPAAATAPAPAITAGAKVTDAKGGDVGTVAAVAAGVATIDTGTVKVGVPLASFATGATGPVLGMTKAELEAAAKGAQASAAAEIAVGDTVSDPSGGAVGKIEAVDATLVTLATANSKARLPKTSFSKGPNGLVIGMTAAQIDAAAKGASADTPAKPGPGAS